MTELIMLLMAQEVVPQETPAQQVQISENQTAQEESMQEESIQSSTQAEEANPSLYNDGENLYAHPDYSFELNFTDVPSGVKSIQYMVDYSGSWSNYTSPIKLQEEGYHTIIYQAIDNVGNKAAQKEFDVIIDASAPQSYIGYTGKVYRGDDGKLYAAASTKFAIASRDALSGVKEIKFSTDGAEAQQYKFPFSIEQEGDHAIDYWAIDNVGNVENKKSFSVYIDTTAPEVKIVSSKEPVNINGTLYVSGEYIFSIEANDTASGVSQILVSIDGRPYKKYVSPVVFSTPGAHTISAVAIDNVGNASEEVTAEFVVDILPPEGEVVPVVK